MNDSKALHLEGKSGCKWFGFKYHFHDIPSTSADSSIVSRKQQQQVDPRVKQKWEENPGYPQGGRSDN